MTEPVATSPNATAPSEPALFAQASLQRCRGAYRGEARASSAGVRLRRRWRGGRAYAAPQRTGLRRCRPLAAAAERSREPRPLGDAVRQETLHAAGHWADRPVRPVLAGRRMRSRPCRECCRRALHRQPRFRLHAGGHRRGVGRASLDAGLRLYRPRFPARDDRACGSGEIRRAGSHHRQPVARQPRARHPQRLFHSAALRYRWHARRRDQGTMAAPHADDIAEDHLRQLSETRREGGTGADSRPHGKPARSEHVLGRRRLDTLLLERPDGAEGHPAHGGSEGSGCARHRWHHRFEPWRAAARRRRRFVRRAAGCRRCGRRANPCPGRWRHPAWRRRGQGAGARRLVLPHRPAAALGTCGRRRSRRSPRA